MEYNILVESEVDITEVAKTLAKHVNDAIKDGFTPIGGVVTIVNHHSTGYTLLQTMIMKD